ncbi:MAG: hypothetical protein IPJ01_11640 [Micavibrio sp.]|nr:hypothetical protein [Micavibrio sp.]
MNEKAINFLENALRNNHCIDIQGVIVRFNLMDRINFNKHFEIAEKRINNNKK